MRLEDREILKTPSLNPKFIGLRRSYMKQAYESILQKREINIFTNQKNIKK